VKRRLLSKYKEENNKRGEGKFQFTRSYVGISEKDGWVINNKNLLSTSPTQFLSFFSRDNTVHLTLWRVKIKEPTETARMTYFFLFMLSSETSDPKTWSAFTLYRTQKVGKYIGTFIFPNISVSNPPLYSYPWKWLFHWQNTSKMICDLNFCGHRIWKLEKFIDTVTVKTINNMKSEILKYPPYSTGLCQSILTFLGSWKHYKVGKSPVILNWKKWSKNGLRSNCKYFLWIRVSQHNKIKQDRRLCLHSFYYIVIDRNMFRPLLGHLQAFIY
jgi:hypothetical protein